MTTQRGAGAGRVLQELVMHHPSTPNVGDGRSIAAACVPHPPAASAAPPALMTFRDISAYTQVPLRTLHRWKASGKFPPPDLSHGRVHRWRRITVDAWVCPCCKQH